MALDLRERSNEEEIMDDFSLEGNDFEDGLDQIANINYWLGGNNITIASLKEIVKNSQKTLKIVDAGCGNGDMCRQVAKFARKHGVKLSIIGIDANPGTIRYAGSLSKKYPEISYLTLDIFSDEFRALKYDILLATLTIHHFEDELLIPWMIQVAENAEKAVIINDLHRSKVAYRLFQLICFVFRMNELNRVDGLISIKRAFKKRDFSKYNQLITKNISELKVSVKWKWAFRYLWIIEKI